MPGSRADAEATAQEFKVGALPAEAMGILLLGGDSTVFATVVSVVAGDDPVLAARRRPAVALRPPNGLVRWMTFWPGAFSSLPSMARLDVLFTLSPPGRVRVVFADAQRWRDQLVAMLYASLIVVVDAAAIDLDSFQDAPMEDFRRGLLAAPHLVLPAPDRRPLLALLKEWQ